LRQSRGSVPKHKQGHAPAGGGQMQKNAPPAGGRQGGNQGAAVARSDNARSIRYHRQERGRRCGLFILLSNGLLIGVDWAAHSRNDAIDVVTAPAQGGSMLSVLIGVLIICIVGALCFWAIDKFVNEARLANLLKLLVVLICLAAILQRLLPLAGINWL
jgi:hypothetical protein